MSNQSRVLCVVLPNKNKVDISVGLEHKGQDVINQLCQLLGLKELTHFGLHFVKAWKRNTLQERIVLHLRVQYYIENGRHIADKAACGLYYADLKGGVVRSWCYAQEGRFFQLAAYALQADLGDWREGEGSYFSPLDYFPPWLVSGRGCDYVLQHTPGLHRELIGMDAHTAALLFIQEAYSLSDVPLTFYNMSKGKKEQSASVWLGLALTGLHVSEMVNGKQQLFYELVWSSIHHLTFKGRRFEIKADPLGGSKLVLYTPSTLHSQHLLKHMSKCHHLHLHTRHSVEELHLLLHPIGGQQQRELYVGDGTDPDTDDSEDELPALKSYLDKVRRCWPGSLSVLRPRQRQSQEVRKSVCADFKEIEMCVDEPEEMCVDDPEEMFVDEPEEMCVDDPEEFGLVAELLGGVCVDGPPFMTTPPCRCMRSYPHRFVSLDFTVEMKQEQQKKEEDKDKIKTKLNIIQKCLNPISQ
ncbi:FERM domain-containing protein 6 isoform X2 [Brachyhypopomus gauderio]|uniref:FERM domain-containing protein 6 isoform X2 n=1 Tax=Brachyhypopomus gauderio TaxID=698409 RepID=UPI004042927C